MFLAIRMFLYLLFGALAGQGIGVFDGTAGAYTVHVDDIAALIMGLAGYLGTFAASRWAKARGWLT